MILLLATIIWGTSLVTQSIGMSYIGPFTFNAVRFFVGAATLIPIIALKGRKGKAILSINVKKTTLSAGIINGTVLFLTASLQQTGILYTTVGKTGFITSLYIIFVPIFGLFLHKRIHWYVWFGIIIALTGMYLLCMNEKAALGIGDMLILLCAATTAVHILLTDHFSENVNSILFSCIQFLVCSILSLFAALLFEKITPDAITAASLPIIYTGVFSCGIAYTLQTLGQKYVSPVTAALILSMEAVFSVIAGWVFLGETLTLKELLGCIFIFTSILSAQLPEMLKTRRQNRRRA